MAKKLFPCGHKGKGQYCHRCDQEKEQQEIDLQRKKEQQDWEDLFSDDPVNLHVLENDKLVKKARNIISEIHSGTSYTKYRGKRMQYDRDIISVPLTRDWRLIFISDGNIYKCSKLMTHEDYNVRKLFNK